MRRSGSGMPTRFSQSTAFAIAASPRMAVWRSMTSVIWRPTVMTGFKLVDGSWKMMLMRRPRMSRIFASGNCVMSVPSTSTLPELTRPLSGSRRRIDKAVIDLPQPDWPTNAKVSPRLMVSERASTARTRPLSESISVVRFPMASMRPLRNCGDGAGGWIRRGLATLDAERPGTRIEGLAHGAGKKSHRQDERHHETECRKKRPPDDGVAGHFIPCAVDHRAEAVGRRIHAHAHIGQDGLVEHESREIEHGDDHHDVRDVGQDVAAHDARVRHAERARRLHVIELAQFERLGAEQARESGPAGDAQNRSQQEEPNVGALEASVEQLWILVDEHLD